MSPERRTLSRLTLPLRVLADRFAFGALVVLSLALLAVGKANLHLLDGVSTRIGDALVPALEALMQPVTASRRLVEGVGELLALGRRMHGSRSRTCACSNGRAPRAS